MIEQDNFQQKFYTFGSILIDILSQQLYALDYSLFWSGARTIQDFFEYLLFGKLCAKTHFNTAIFEV